MAVIHINGDNFEQLVQHGQKPVLLDFWATWCGPCRMLAPILEEIAALRDDIVVGKIDVDEEGALAARFGIVSIPTLILMRGGEVAATAVGYRPKEDILKILE